MENLTSPAVIKRLMERHNITFSKRLGQNFIINPSVCPRIADLAGAAQNVSAIEIGPGLGVLTAQLAMRCQSVTAIEIDRRLPPLLAESLADFHNVEVVSADVLELDLNTFIAQRFAGREVIVCANLPYYITTPIIMKLLEEKLPLKSVTVMVQKETARRICAPLPSRAAGAITAAISYYSQPKILFDVSHGSFMPAPDVDSSVIKLDIRSAPPVSVSDEKIFFHVIKSAFAMRRKTILNTLAAGLQIDKLTLSQLLNRIGVSPTARAEQLTLLDFANISNIIG